MALRGKDIEAILIIAVEEHETVFRNEADHVPEGAFDRLEVVEDIGVIELDIVHDRNFGEVVDELGALVEKGGVIFIAFKDVDFGIVKTSPLPEIAGDASDHKTGALSGGFKNPRKKRGGCRFPMRPCDDEIPLSAEDLIAKQFRQRNVVQLATHDLFDLGVPAALGVPDDKQVDVIAEVFRLVTVENFDAPTFKKGLHGVVDLSVRSSDLVAGVAKRSGDGSHRGSTNPHEIEVLPSIQNVTHRKK